ncbi:17134_t:CDS:2 [Cetraspora pellucida]|uniref:17134_t:CDS:1 n=1 Tax=Cetraspora pellucida TaxID=1433469 RepID=A0A9N9HJU0_9GLOM|nr:17134_t:CDS:2 [Cetraspora pellucida]
MYSDETKRSFNFQIVESSEDMIDLKIKFDELKVLLNKDEIEQNLGNDNNQNSEKEDSKKSNDKEEDANMIKNDYEEKVDEMYKGKIDYEAEEEAQELQEPLQNNMLLQNNSPSSYRQHSCLPSFHQQHSSLPLSHRQYLPSIHQQYPKDLFFKQSNKCSYFPSANNEDKSSKDEYLNSMISKELLYSLLNVPNTNYINSHLSTLQALNLNNNNNILSNKNSSSDTDTPNLAKLLAEQSHILFL